MSNVTLSDKGKSSKEVADRLMADAKKLKRDTPREDRTLAFWGYLQVLFSVAESNYRSAGREYEHEAKVARSMVTEILGDRAVMALRAKRHG